MYEIMKFWVLSGCYINFPSALFVLLIRTAPGHGIVLLSNPSGRTISASLLAAALEPLVVVFTSHQCCSLIYPVHRQIKYAVSQD